MKHNNRSNVGMELLVQRYKKKFEIEENINYYSYEDFIQAERKYLKFVLEGSGGAGEFQPE
jgi:hypothetical protein